MLCEAFDDGWRDGGDIGTGQCGFLDMIGTADGSGQNFGLESVIVVNGADILDQFHAVDVHVIKATDERRDIGCASFGCKQSLVGGEAQGDIDFVALISQRFTGFQAVDGQWQFDANILCDFQKLCCFFQHRVAFQCGHFGRNRTIGDLANLCDHFLEVATGFNDQGRVGGDAIDQTGCGQFANVVGIGSIDKEFHCAPSSVSVSHGRAYSAGRQSFADIDLSFILKFDNSQPLNGEKMRIFHPQTEQDPLLSQNVQIVSVLVPVFVDRSYSYRVPQDMVSKGHDGLVPGQIVKVPLGPRSVLGVVWDDASDFKDESRLKDVECAYEDMVLSDDFRQFIDWIASYTLAQRGMVLRMVLRVEESLLPPGPIRALRLDGDPPVRMTKARQRVLEAMEGGLAETKSALVERCGVSSGVLDGLVRSGTLEMVELPPPPMMQMPDPDFAPPVLSEGQANAASEIVSLMEEETFHGILLDGVTGSGKTEVYFEAIAKALKRGEQVLIMVPEIALTSAFLDRFEGRFGARPAEWHTDIGPRQKNRIWHDVARGAVRVVVGARSALMLPFQQLGLIIVDEEHDGAYKQEDRAIYHARDMAIVRGHLCGFPVILASATPSIESHNNARSGRYHHICLPSRYGGHALPDIALVDMRAEPPEKGEWMSPALVAAVNETLEAGEQSLLFLNRRGYAPLTLCRTCGHRFQCPSCSTWLVEHRFRKQLQCHHCGHVERVPEACPECGNEDSLVACGPGVERIAEEAAQRWPDRHIVILSSDHIQGVQQLRAELEQISSGRADIIIGTQLVAKGHNFPAMTLVGVIDADLGLAHGDLRAGEKVFQTLAQVTGRAGRMSGKGRGLLQTYAPDHPVIKALAGADWEGFYTYELEQRQKAAMPPFGRLAAIIISAEQREAALSYGRAMVRVVPNQQEVRVLGPAEAPLSVLRGRFRFRLLVMAPRAFSLSGWLRHWQAACPKPTGSVRVQIDVDPVSFV